MLNLSCKRRHVNGKNCDGDLQEAERVGADGLNLRDRALVKEATGKYYVDRCSMRPDFGNGAMNRTASLTARNRIASASAPKIRWDESFLIGSRLRSQCVV